MSFQGGDIPEGRRSSESSGGNSWLSQETVKDNQTNRYQRNHAMLNGRLISPFSGFAKADRSTSQGRKQPPTLGAHDLSTSNFTWPSPDVSPTDKRKDSGFTGHRKSSAAIGPDEPGPPPTFSSSPRISCPNSDEVDYFQQDPNASYSSSPKIAPGDGNGAFFQDHSEHEASPASTSFRPGTSRTYASEPLELDYNGDHRRPSVASATTISSQGSKSSTGGRFRKKLKGFFGEDYLPGDSKLESDNGSQHPTKKSSLSEQHIFRERANSDGARSPPQRLIGESSPQRPRPRAPLPSSEITPWVFQSFNDIPQYGEAPVREAPIGADGRRAAAQMARGSQRNQTGRQFSGHRHSRSKEEKSTTADDITVYPSRPTTGRDDFGIGLRANSLNNSAMNSTSTLVRSTSPTPSMQSAHSREQGQSSPGTQLPNKRSILDKIRRPKAHGPLKHFPGAKGVQEAKSTSKLARRDVSPARRGRQGSLEGTTTPKTGDESDRKKDGRGLAISSAKLRGRRVLGTDTPSKDTKPAEEQEGMYELDTDLSHMEGIVRKRSPQPSADRNQSVDGDSKLHEEGKSRDGLPTGHWDAPDSWHVRRHGEDNAPPFPSGDIEVARTVPQPDGAPYFIRVFRVDSTFATLSTGLNATVADILVILGRKSFLTDHLHNYEIVMRRNELTRQLDPSEKPILMQKEMLERIGYTSKDRIEEVGREDHSYVIRFTFLPNKLNGLTSLQGGDSGFNRNQKFSHVDLSNRCLVTIPISLYSKAAEIISLNLSKNLNLDVPKDFIQGCINLRELKFIGNEAPRLPASFGLASRLTYLDVSNNYVEQLDNAGLDKLQGLVSIKLSNNKLTSLPSYFGNFAYLRSLNLSSNNFRVFPEFLGNLKNLVDLDISFNNIAEVPCIGRLSTLERLWMTNNVLRGALDESFKDLVNVKEIDARFNEITNIDNLSYVPRLEQLHVGHNAISKFKGSFPKLRTLLLDHCPITQFDIDAPMPTLTLLNIASAKLVQLRDTLFENAPNLTKLVLDKNHFVSMSSHIGKLRKLEHFSIIKNPLDALPATFGCLTELRYLNLRECNLSRLPPELWNCNKLETLNVSSNVLDSFPKHGTPMPQLPGELVLGTPGTSTPTNYEDLAADDQEGRRPSQTSGSVLSTGGSPNGSGGYRKPSVASSLSQGGRKVSTASRSLNEGSPASRKDSSFSNLSNQTFCGSLRNLYLADNRLEDDIFRELSLLTELRVVNLSYNELTELPQGLLKRWSNLTELYLSGNELTSLPSDDLEEGSQLKILNINANRFQVLPAELCKVSKLSILDVGSNSLKYNVSNWPYDWNWNWNRNLKYLNFSGNKRLEIKPHVSSLLGPPNTNGTDLTDFNSLTYLRVLGLMDVTLTTSTIPEENEDRRVRTSASLAGFLAYGMADFLGKSEHLSIIDMIVPRLKPDNVETVVGMFDGTSQSTGGSKIAKYLHENFLRTFSTELRKLRRDLQETPLDALRRAFLALNKNMAAACFKTFDDKTVQRYEEPPDQKSRKLTNEDGASGGVATVLYLRNMDLFVANVGDAQAILVKSDGSLRHLTRTHDPAEPHERARIRAAGGYVSRQGKLNDVLPVSRSFGHFHLMPALIAAPHTMHVNLTEQDEMIILASRELWDYVTPDLVVDVTRAERRDLMVAAQKIRDLAISFGANNKLMVMILGVGDLKKRDRQSKFRNASVSTGMLEEQQILPTSKRTKKPRDMPGDSRLARFEFVDAPVGELAIIFTDIKGSTSLWETCPDAMRSAIQIHNDILRRQLGIIGGYEVKTEGDAFMVAFSTTTAALLWCFNCQMQLLEAEWPTEILEQTQCQVEYDMDNNIIFRGLSVRMGIHWGEPVCEKDPVTNRMDYFGPMVNRASRISAVADGGQIFVSSDFMSDIQRNLEVFADSERAASTGSEEGYAVDNLGYNIRRELQQLNSLGFVIKDQGERKLKGLENPEPLYLIYPHTLSGRLSIMQKDAASDKNVPTTISKHSQLEIQTDLIWRLWEITLRLERLCGALEYPGEARLKEPNVSLFNVVKNHGGELADSTVVSLVEQQVTRIEMTVNTLAIRNMLRPFRPHDRLNDHAMPIRDVLQELQTQLAEYRALKEQISVSAAGITGSSPSYTASLEDSNSSVSSSFLRMSIPADDVNN